MAGEPNQVWVVAVCFAVGIVVAAVSIGLTHWPTDQSASSRFSGPDEASMGAAA